MTAKFIGRAITEWLDPVRDMRLCEPLTFVDSRGKRWVAETGHIIDGASIPRFFWRFIGSPFVGKYRKASIIHDVYCVTKSEPYQDVHRMFYEAMLVSNVTPLKAKLMYWAVKYFGPRW